MLIERLGSAHLEDMAIIALTRTADMKAFALHPELNDPLRARLRSRIKQIGRHDWPANGSEDPLIRRGYTLRQCYRLVVAMLLVDAHLAPSHAIALAKANELTFLRMMLHRTADHQPVAPVAKLDPIAVVMLGELAELVVEDDWKKAEPDRVRIVERGQLCELWLTNDLAHVGQQLPLDVGAAAVAVWRWISERRLMTDSALSELRLQVLGESGAPGYTPSSGPIKRR